MTDQHFQAPPVPPPTPSFTQPTAPVAQAHAAVGEAQSTPATDMVLPPDNLAARFKLSPNIYKTKTMCLLFAGMLGIGVVMGAVLFGGGSPQKTAQVSGGLSGVVKNPDIIEKNLKRCGLVSRSSPCIVYLVNHSQNDKRAEDFFDEAIQKTGRQRYLVEIENKQYRKKPISPGQIAQIKIPALR